MGKRKGFLGSEFSDRFKESYANLSYDRQKGADRVVIALMKQETTPGMRIKPIEPEKYYYEARINDGDRLVHRIEGERILFVDVVPHDDVKRYGKRVSGLF